MVGLVLLSVTPRLGAGTPVVPGDESSPTAGKAWHSALELRGGIGQSRDVAALVERARAEFLIGSLDPARTALAQASLLARRPDPQVLRLRAMVEYATGEYVLAGLLFAAAADLADPVRRGVLEGRAGDAFERAGLERRARQHYRRAARLLPNAAGWLAVREARLHQDTAVVVALLRRAGPAEQRMAARVWADAFMRLGDTARAVSARERGGQSMEAADLALAAGDVVRGRRLFYRASRDGAGLRPASTLERVLVLVPPQNTDEVVAVAGVLRRVGRGPEAVQLLRTAATEPGWDGRVLVAAAEALSDAGDRAAALEILERAASLDGSVGADAQYALGRLLIRARGEAVGLPRLLQFTKTHPTHPAVPSALLLVADAWQRAGRHGDADSLFAAIVAAWPRHLAASQARLRSARDAERYRRLDRARVLYAGVRDAGGPDAFAAQFMHARVALAMGDSVGALEEWTALARRDSLGYYGMVAREAAGLPLPAMNLANWAAPAERVQTIAARVAVLNALEFADESNEEVAWGLDEIGADTEQLLTFARWLLAAGRTEMAVNLGWKASAVLGLNDARVLRLVFPWPMREAVVREARKFDLDPYLLAGLIRQESMFRPAVTSRAGARGLMQLMPGTATDVARRLGVEWHDGLLGVADANLHLGAAHLASLLRRFGGDEVLALAAYNAGGRPVERWQRSWEPGDRVMFIERIPYIETRGYVRTVVRNRSLYRALYPSLESP